MSLRRWIPLWLVDDLLDAGNLPIVGIGQEADLIVRIRRQHLGHRPKLRWKVWVGEKKSHGEKKRLDYSSFVQKKAESLKKILSDVCARAEDLDRIMDGRIIF